MMNCYIHTKFVWNKEIAEKAEAISKISAILYSMLNIHPPHIFAPFSPKDIILYLCIDVPAILSPS